MFEYERLLEKNHGCDSTIWDDYFTICVYLKQEWEHLKR